MRKIFALVAFLVFVKCSFSQGYPLTQVLGSDSTIVISKGALQSRLINVTFTDTTQANTQRIKAYPGAQIATTTGGINLWVRNATATAWVPVAVGSGNNIYTIDGTLTGNRTLSGGGNSLTFTGLSQFLLSVGNQTFTVKSDSATLTKRLSYTTNLGSTFKMYSLVDKNYVDSSITASPAGTVTQVNTNNGSGITGGPITSTGTLAIDTLLISTRAWRQKGVDSLQANINLKLNIVDTTGMLANYFRTAGVGLKSSGQTVYADTLLLSTRAWRQKGVDSVAALINNNVSGTPNYVSKFTGTHTIGNSQIYDNGTAVGINTTSPTARLDIKDTSGIALNVNERTSTTANVALNVKSVGNRGFAALIDQADSSATGTQYNTIFRKSMMPGTGNPAPGAGVSWYTQLGNDNDVYRALSVYRARAIDTTGFSSSSVKGSSTEFWTRKNNVWDTTLVLNQGNVGIGTGQNGIDSALTVAQGAYIGRGIRAPGLPNAAGTKALRIDASGNISYADTLIDAGGTVTSVATNNGTGITGGTITTTGTLAIDTLLISTRAWRQKGIDSVANLPRVTSVGLTMPAAFNVSGSPVTGSGTLAVTAAGNATQYIRGDGVLALFPGGGGGGGGGKIYYLNGGVSLGTYAGITMYELGDTAVIGSAANFTRATTGNIANFITDVNKPGLLQIPSGVWTVNAYLSETGGGSNHAELYSVLEIWNGTTLSTVATSPALQITEGTFPTSYSFDISVPTTNISVTDRIVIQFYIQNTNGKTVTLYTQNGYVGEVHTTFTTGIGSLNGLTAPSQYFATGTSGTDFNISSVTETHTFNLPVASATNTGKLSSTDWSTFNNKVGGSGTSNYLPKFTGTSTIGNSGLQTDANGNLGIGTSLSNWNVGYKAIQSNSTLIISSTTESDLGNNFYIDGTNNAYYLQNGGATIYQQYGSNHRWVTAPSGTAGNVATFTERMLLTPTGLGIGTSPDSLLTVNLGTNLKRGVRMSGLPQAPGTKALRINAAGTISYADTLIDAGGTVTSVATNNGTGITGGTITTTGTLAIDTLLISTRAWRQKGIDSVIAVSAGKYVPYTGAITSLDMGIYNIDAQNISSRNFVTGAFMSGISRSDATASAYGVVVVKRGAAGYIRPNPLSIDRDWYLPDADGTIALTSDLSSYVPTSRTLTINGTSYDLSANRSWSVGTVTSVGSGYGLSGGTITSSGTLSVDSATLSNYYLRRKDSLTATNLLGYVTRKVLADTAAAIRGADAGGTVTSVATNNGTGITGGTITTTGTLAIDTLLISTRAWRQKGVDSVAALITGGGYVTGSGTTNYVPKFTGTSTIGNSIVSDNGSRILINTGTTNQNTTINASKIAMSRTSDGAEVVYFSKNTDLGSNGTANINGYDGIQFRTQGAETVKATLDASGNLGLGVTPSAWASGYKAFEFGNSSAAVSALFSNGPNDFWSVSNAYFDGTSFKYITTGTATGYEQVNGSHKWYQVASGSGGTNISFTQAMTLFSTGNLAVGGTSDNGSRLNVTGAATFSSSVTAGDIFASYSGSNAGIEFGNSGSSGQFGFLKWDNASNYLYLGHSYGSAFNRNLVINSSGNVGIGTTSPNNLLEVNGGSSSKGIQVLSSDNPFIQIQATNNPTVFKLYANDVGAYVSQQSNYPLIFNTNSTERMRITSGGAVGIGTTSPSGQLEIAGGTNVYQRIANTTDGVNLDFVVGTTSTGPIIVTQTNHPLRLGTNDTERMRITSGGNVGIGTTSPDSALTVQTGAWVKRGLRLSGLPTGVGTKELRIDANGVVYANDTLSNDISGSGTTNYIPKFTSSSAIGNSIIQESSSKIGINVTPTVTFEVSSSDIAAFIKSSSNAVPISIFNTGGAISTLGFKGSTTTNEYSVRLGANANDFVFYTTNTERMRLDASGRLGIGTSSPTYTLDVNGTARINATSSTPLTVESNQSATFIGLKDGSGNFTFLGGDDGAFLVNTPSGGYSTKLTLDFTGNLGLGVTPSAWGSGEAAMQTTYGTFIGNSGLNVGRNAYYNAGWKYIGTGNATLYVQTSGEHQWLTAPSGTAGNAISFTQAMTLFSTGNLAVGGTSDNGSRLNVTGSGYFSNTVSNLNNLIYSGGSLFLRNPANTFDWALYQNASNSLNIDFNGANRVLITSGGNVGIGTTSPTFPLDIRGNVNVQSTTTAQLFLQSNSGGYLSSINVGGTGNGLGYTSGEMYFANSSNAIIFNTKASSGESMRITSGGNVGIGTTSPGNNLHIFGSSAQSLAVESTGAASFLGIYSGNSYTADLRFGDFSALRGKIQAETNDDMTFFTGGLNERMRITSGGNVLLGAAATFGVNTSDGSDNSYMLISGGGAAAAGRGAGLVINGNDRTTYGGQLDLFTGDAATAYMTFSSAGAERMRITSGGDLLIATTTDAGAYPLQVNGSVYATAYYESSDLRKKNVLSERQGSDGINTITFKWKDGRDSLTHIGYAAQQVEKVLPDAVKTNPDGYKTINYDEVQTLKISNLEKEIAELKELVKKLMEKK